MSTTLCSTGGGYANYATARHRAFQKDPNAWDWRAKLLRQPGVGLRRKESGHATELYTSQKSIGLAGFVVTSALLSTLPRQWKRHFRPTRPRPEASAGHHR